VLEQARLSDARGYLQKILMASQCNGNPPRGEVYVTAALPGEAKGNHLHRKMGEWFAIVEGEGTVEICDPESGQRRSIPLGVSRPRSVYVPPGLAHAVVNTGKQTLVCVAWAERDYDAGDIFPYPVWPR
jgi:oxalate decarboxylase/phosphoglucose isomerase-like protein (cupin superfamily)